jgi:hypothetical protein
MIESADISPAIIRPKNDLAIKTSFLSESAMVCVAFDGLIRVRTYLIGRCNPVLVVIVYALLPHGNARADSKPDLLAIVKTRHRAASEMIRSLSATFKYESLKPKAEVVSSGEYRRSLGIVRIHEGTDGQWTSDILVNGGETRVVGRYWTNLGGIEYRAERASGTQMIGLSDMWMGMLMVVVGPNGEPMTIDRLLDCAKRAPSVSQVTEDGRKCIRVELEYDAPDGRAGTTSTATTLSASGESLFDRPIGARFQQLSSLRNRFQEYSFPQNVMVRPLSTPN